MNNKPRNGPLSPRDHREREYIHYNSMNNHHHSSHNNNHHHHSPQQHHHHHHQQQQPPPPQQAYHPNSDLINFVSSAWKEKVRKKNGCFEIQQHSELFFQVSSDKTEYFKSTESEKIREFDLESWISAKMRNSTQIHIVVSKFAFFDSILNHFWN